MKSLSKSATKTGIILIGLICNLFYANNGVTAATTGFAEIPAIDSTLAIQLQDALDNQRAKLGLVGISAAVVMPNDSIWVGASGMSNPANEDTLRTDMLFRTGSVGKNLTATVVFQLAEEGILALDDSLYQWLPALPNIDSTITIGQLLDHTSGVYHFIDPSVVSVVFSDPDKYWTQEEVISTFVHEPYFTPGAGFYYSSTNYVLLSMIIEEATGSDFPVAMEDRLGEIDRLDHTYFAWSDTIPGDIAHPWYDLDGDGTLDDAFDKFKTAVASVSFGTGGVISTAEDMAGWMKYLFEGNLLSQESMEQMLNFQTGWYGMGVMNSWVFGNEFWGHTGWSPGYLTIVYYSPADSISIAVLSNDDWADRHAIFSALLEVVYASYRPRLAFDNSMFNIGELSTGISEYDTSFVVYNTGGDIDSVHTYINYSGDLNSDAFSIEPSEFELAPGDSQVVIFTLTPNLLSPDQYTIKLYLESKFSPITPLVAKTIKFKIPGASNDNVIMKTPVDFMLNQNYPNPFNPSTTIQYTLTQPQKVVLKIFNLQGQEVETLINEKQNAGSYQVLWYPMDMPGGIYIYRLEAEGLIDSKKLIYVK